MRGKKNSFIQYIEIGRKKNSFIQYIVTGGKT